MMRRLLILFCGLCAAACQSTRPDPLASLHPGAPYSLSAGQIAKIKKAVAEYLKDPDFAHFSEPFTASKDGDNLNICGLVKGKGGYSGTRPFHVTGFESKGVFVTIGVGDGDTGDLATFEACRRLGAAIN